MAVVDGPIRAAAGGPRARDVIAGPSAIVVLTGAGISTDSGIPDFRGPNGLWTKNPAAEKAATSALPGRPRVRRSLAEPADDAGVDRRAEPRPPGDRRARAAGRLHAVVTQNIDGLHQKAGNDADR